MKTLKTITQLVAHSIRKRKMLIFSTLVLIISLPLAYLTLRYGQKTEAAWWNDGWMYRKKIPVTNNTSTETNVYITLTINTSDTSKFQSDCGDLRFTKNNGQLLEYYIVSGCGTSSTTIHVNFDTFPTGSQTIYYYYGNPSAENGFSSSDFSTEASNYTVGTFGSEEKSPGPAAYWKFDEGYGQTVNDSTRNNNDGTLGSTSGSDTNDPIWKPESECMSGKCLYFDGTDDYVEANSYKGILGNNPRTVSMWVKYLGGSGYVISWGKDEGLGGSSTQRYDLSIENGDMYTRINGAYIGFDTNIPENRWTHIVWVYPGTTLGDTKVYVNGKRITTVAASLGTSNSLNTLSGRNVKIGVHSQGGSAYFKGFIDEVKIYPYARSAEQIKADYLAGLAGVGAAKGSSAVLGSSNLRGSALSDGLVAYYKFDESSWTNDCSTATVTDASGNGNNGKACPASTGPTGGAAGKFGNGGSFDGSDDYVETGQSFAINNYLTISAWVKPTSSCLNPSQGCGFIGNSQWAGGGLQGKGWHLGWYYDGLFKFLIEDGNSGNTYIASATTSSYFTADKWTHVVGVFDGTNMFLYIDGQLAGSYYGATAPNTTTYTLKIGKDPQGGWTSPQFSGSIDEVRIYNRALSPREVRALYEWAPNPRVYLRLDEGSGSTANDSSGNNRPGTIFNALWSIGKFGKGIKLDGNNDYIQIPDF